MLKTLGFTEHIININKEYSTDQSQLARVVTVHKDRYIVRMPEGIYNAEIMGNLRYTAQHASDFPIVGDWVHCIPMDKQTVVIKSVLNRYSTLERKAIGQRGENQMIASNIDFACIVMAVNQDFNLNRLDRYMSICYTGGITPIVVLTKTDLIDLSQIETYRQHIQARYSNPEIYTLSMFSEELLDGFRQSFRAYNTYCFIGSSGVGKSTLINYLLNTNVLKTNTISSWNSKGKHTTTHRELFILNNGSIVIDTPGMREIGMANSTDGIDLTFERITELAHSCKFSDCTHTNEAGCEILHAVETGDLPEDMYINYLKLKREEAYYVQSAQSKKQRGKKMSKMIRHVMKQKRNQKY